MASQPTVTRCAALLGAGFAALALTACSPATEAFVKAAPRLVPEQFFAGTLKADAVAIDRFGVMRDTFAMDLTGTWDGSVLVLDERFTFHDGATGRRVWKIRKLADTVYEGQADDVEGVGRGDLSGNGLHWRFTAPLRPGDPESAGEVDQWMLLQDSGVLLTRSVIRKWGIRVADVVLVFRKVP